MQFEVEILKLKKRLKGARNFKRDNIVYFKAKTAVNSVLLARALTLK